MPKFGSPFPLALPPRDDVEQAPIGVQARAAPGEVALDAVIRAQSTAPQIARRITELETCLWALADYLERRAFDKEGLALVERARETLKTRLEIDEAPTEQGEISK